MPEERILALFELRELYHEVIHPATEQKDWIDLLAALDVSGIRFLIVGVLRPNGLHSQFSKSVFV